MKTSNALLTTEGLARELRQSQATIRRWRKEGKLPFIALGDRRTRYSLPRVLEALRKLETPAKQEKVAA